MVSKNKVATEETTDDRKRVWFGQRSSYYEMHDENQELRADAPSEDEWREIVASQMQEIVDSGFAVGIRFIFHDKDEANGVHKATHVHFYASLKNRESDAKVRQVFHVSDTRKNLTAVKDKRGANEYLLHISAKARKDRKFIYSESDLHEVGVFKTDYHAIIDPKNSNKDTVTQEGEVFLTSLNASLANLSYEVSQYGYSRRMVKDIIRDKFPYTERENLSHDAYVHFIFANKYSKYTDDINAYKIARASDFSQNGRAMTNVFISGVGGSGKSTFAMDLARYLAPGYDVFKAAGKGKGKTFDFADGYEVQPVGIDDDTIGSNFEMDEFLKNFDPIIYSKMSARSKNRDYLADYTMFSSSVGIGQFVADVLAYSQGGSAYQLDERSGTYQFIGKEPQILDLYRAYDVEEPEAPKIPRWYIPRDSGMPFGRNSSAHAIEEFEVIDNQIDNYNAQYKIYHDGAMKNYIENRPEDYQKYLDDLEKYEFEKRNQEASFEKLVVPDLVKYHSDKYVLKNDDLTRDRFFQMNRRFKFYVKIDVKKRKISMYEFKVIDKYEHKFEFVPSIENVDYDVDDVENSLKVAQQFAKYIKENRVVNPRKRQNKNI